MYFFTSFSLSRRRDYMRYFFPLFLRNFRVWRRRRRRRRPTSTPPRRPLPLLLRGTSRTDAAAAAAALGAAAAAAAAAGGVDAGRGRSALPTPTAAADRGSGGTWRRGRCRRRTGRRRRTEAGSALSWLLLQLLATGGGRHCSRSHPRKCLKLSKME